MKNKLLLLFAALCLLLTVNGAFVSAQDTEPRRIIFMRDKGTGVEVPAPETAVSVGYLQGLSENYDAMLAYMYQETLKCSDSIDISNYYCTVSDFSKLVDFFIYRYPCSFVDRTEGYQYKYYVRNGECIMKSVSFTYLFDAAGSKKAKALVDEATDRILSKLNDQMTDLEKVLIIHDEIVDNATYDVEAVQSGELTGMTYSIYGNLVNGVSVCQGYTETLSYILSQIGIPHKACYSLTLDHIWNYVEIDGKWYHLDATWDDPTNITIVGHNYFLTSDETQIALKETSDFATYGIDAEPPACSSKRYESGYVFNGVQGKFYYEDGAYHTVRKVKEQGIETDWTYSYGKLQNMAVTFAQAVVDPSKQTNNVTLRLKNNSGTLDNALFYIVYYDAEGKMTKVETANASSVNGAGSKIITTTADLDCLQEGYARLFLWNGVSFAPYASTAVQLSIAH